MGVDGKVAGVLATANPAKASTMCAAAPKLLGSAGEFDATFYGLIR